MPHPSFGLTSLLDHEPFELPDGLAQTYSVPDDYASVAAAASAVAALLADCSERAATGLGFDLSMPWETTARQRLGAATRYAPGVAWRPTRSRAPSSPQGNGQPFVVLGGAVRHEVDIVSLASRSVSSGAEATDEEVLDAVGV